MAFKQKSIFQESSNSLEDTKIIGRELSLYFKPGDLVGLSGDLGAGKTELIRAICGALGDNSMVSSPTYALENQYIMPNGMLISHWDLYRLSSVGDIYAELVEQKEAKKSVIFVEWPDSISDLLDYMVLISCSESGARKISVFSNSKN